MLKEYGIEKEIMVKKYTSPAVKWYKRQLRAYAAGTGFAEPKPKKEIEDETDDWGSMPSFLRRPKIK